ncbi:MAG: hypothetical protein IPJ77_19110 [Planctomycetes bacterium]|nr:hypothetical protein [Planctomycetota bacterium]
MLKSEKSVTDVVAYLHSWTGKPGWKEIQSEFAYGLWQALESFLDVQARITEHSTETCRAVATVVTPRQELATSTRAVISPDPAVASSAPTKVTPVRADQGSPVPSHASSVELAGLTDTQKTMLRVLARATQDGEGMTRDQLMAKLSVGSHSTVERSIAALRKRGLQVSNGRNGAGYFLEGKALELGLAL